MKQTEIAALNRPAKGNRICKLVKSNPNVILNVHMVDLNTPLKFMQKILCALRPKKSV